MRVRRPTTGSLSSRARSAWLAIRLKISTRKIGPAAIADSSVTSTVRRSRDASTQLLARDCATMRCERARARAALRAHAASPSPLPSSVDERVLERRGARLRDELAGGALRDDAAVREDHDAVAQRGDLLHDVRSRTAGTCRRRAARASCSRSARTLMMSRPLVGSSSRIVGGIVHQRARDRDLHALALREALRAAVGERRRARASRAARRRARRARRRTGRAARRSSGCSRARSAAGRGRARRAARRCARARRSDRATTSRPSTRARARVGDDQRDEHAQHRRLAGAVGAEQAGDLAVGRDERHAVDRAHVALAPNDLTRPSTSIMARPPGGRAQRRPHAALEVRRCRSCGSCRSRASSTKLRDQPRRAAHAATRCGRSRARRCGGCADSVFATSAPYAGGVTGSRPPDSISTGTSLVDGLSRSRRARCRAATRRRRRARARASARSRPSGERLHRVVARDARHVLGAGDREVQRGVQLLGAASSVRRRASRQQRRVVAGCATRRAAPAAGSPISGA